jgi:hypothetical protein
VFSNHFQPWAFFESDLGINLLFFLLSVMNEIRFFELACRSFSSIPFDPEINARPRSKSDFKKRCAQLWVSIDFWVTIQGKRLIFRQHY